MDQCPLTSSSCRGCRLGLLAIRSDFLGGMTMLALFTPTGLAVVYGLKFLETARLTSLQCHILFDRVGLPVLGSPLPARH